MSKNPLVAAVEEGIEALRSGRRLRSHAVSIQPPPKYNAGRIVAIRKEKVGASQVRFARFLGVSPSTVRAWEQRQRVPSLPAASFRSPMSARRPCLDWSRLEHDSAPRP